MNTVSPKSTGLYLKGHIEVPNPNLPPGGYAAPYQQYETIPPGAYREQAPGENIEPQQPTPQDPPLPPLPTIPTPPVVPSSYRAPRGQVTIDRIEQPPRNVGAATVQTPSRPSDNRYNRLNAKPANSYRSTNADSSVPGLIGPIGYDLQQ
jgi:hypothetical protein